jgi:hypothetical protein
MFQPDEGRRRVPRARYTVTPAVTGNATRFWTLGERKERLETWARQQLGWPTAVLTPASADASFRRYFRIEQQGESYILMDAPPEREDSRPFVRISRLFLELGLHVPQIHAEDLAQGFLLLSDLGRRVYLYELDAGNVDRLYGDALGAGRGTVCRRTTVSCCCLKCPCSGTGCWAHTLICR